VVSSNGWRKDQADIVYAYKNANGIERHAGLSQKELACWDA
jgi:hypothetical protein